MPLDPVSTSLVGLGVGALGVVVHAGAHYADGSLTRSREKTLFALFFAFLAGFLFTWVWSFASPSLGYGRGMTGALWGGLIWAAFVLPTEVAHLAWGRRDVASSGATLSAWLGQFIVGGALCGVLLVS